MEFKYELQDIQAMIELCKFRDSLASRHKKALEKANKWSLEKNAPKNDKQESAKNADLQNEKDEKELLDSVTKLILYSQAEMFHQTRMRIYRRQLGHFAVDQIAATQTLLATWNEIRAIVDNSEPI